MTTSQESYGTDEEGYLSENQKDIAKVGAAGGIGALAGGPVGLAGTAAGAAMGSTIEYGTRKKKADRDFSSRDVGETYDGDLREKRLEAFNGDLEAAREEYGENLGDREMTLGEKAKSTGIRTVPLIGAGAAADAFGDEAYQAATEYGMEIMDTAATSAPELAGAGAAAALGGAGALMGLEKLKSKLE